MRRDGPDTLLRTMMLGGGGLGILANISNQSQKNKKIEEDLQKTKDEEWSFQEWKAKNEKKKKEISNIDKVVAKKKLQMTKKSLAKLMEHEGYAGHQGAKLKEWDTKHIKSDAEGNVLENPKNMKWGEKDYGAYFDSKGYLTTGIGHLISKSTVGSEQFWKDVDKHEQEMGGANVMDLDEESAKLQFAKDAKEKGIDRLDSLIQNKELDQDLVDALAIETFRGSVPQSKKTIELINQEKYDEASKEFLNNKEYKNEKTPSGIKSRMKDVSDLLMKEAEKKKKKKNMTMIKDILSSMNNGMLV